jgi:hypothetical protein
MPSVPPNISTLPAPATQVVGVGGVSYESIQESMGSHAYGVRDIYQYSTSLIQIMNTITLKKYDANGTKFLYNLTPTIDPYQSTSALNISTKGIDYAFDGNNGFYPILEANTTIQYRIEVYDLSVGDLMLSKNNFEDLEMFSDFNFDTYDN